MAHLCSAVAWLVPCSDAWRPHPSAPAAPATRRAGPYASGTSGVSVRPILHFDAARPRSAIGVAHLRYVVGWPGPRSDARRPWPSALAALAARPAGLYSSGTSGGSACRWPARRPAPRLLMHDGIADIEEGEKGRKRGRRDEEGGEAKDLEASVNLGGKIRTHEIKGR